MIRKKRAWPVRTCSSRTGLENREETQFVASLISNYKLTNNLALKLLPDIFLQRSRVSIVA